MACYYGESVGYIDYSEEYDEEQTLAKAVSDGVISDIVEVVEVSIDDVLNSIAVSPTDDGSRALTILSKYFAEAKEELETAV